MADQGDTTNKDLNKALEGTKVATNVALVLFAALITSFLGLWNQIGPFRKALAAQQRYERRQGEADAQNKAQIAREVRGILASQSLAKTDERAPALLKLLVVQKDKQPADIKDAFEVLKELQKAKDPLALVLTRDIDEAISNLRRQSSNSLQRFHLERATAESTSFKLLGLEFSVDGFWAWDVWNLFWCGGVLYLWLVRRGTLIRARRNLADGSAAHADAPAEQVTSPVWIRPLSSSEPLTSRADSLSVDIVMDPLSALCLLLMWTCTVIAITAVIRMAVIAMGLMIGADGHRFAATVHAAVCCLTVGLAAGAIFDWYAPKIRWAKKTKKTTTRREQEGGQELISRRTWIAGLIGSLGTICLYWNPAKRQLVRSLLNQPRFNRPGDLRGPRKRRSSNVKVDLKPGFYVHRSQTIYYVPSDGRSRHLARLGDSELAKWEGPFDSSEISRVHESALIPFVREAVRSKIPTRRKRNDPKLLATLLDDASVRDGFHQAFDLTKAAIREDEKRKSRRGKVPNLQLYDLLGSIALGCASTELLQDAAAILSAAQIQPIKLNPPPSERPGSKSTRQKSTHSRHTLRKSKESLVCRRAARFEKYRVERLGTAAQTQYGSMNYESRSGWWKPRKISIDNASAIPILRFRKRHRKPRHRSRKKLSSC